MPQRTFDDPAVRSAMAGYLKAASELDMASEIGAEARDLLDLAESKAMAGMALRKALAELGWSAPVSQRTTQ